MGEIQDGIYWDAIPEHSHRGFFKACFVSINPNAAASDVHGVLESAWSMLQRLREGVQPRLGQDFPVDPMGLDILLGYGHQFFDDYDYVDRPQSMINELRFLPAGGKVLPGSGIQFLDIESNPGDTHLIFQMTANSPLAVHRAHVELWRIFTSPENTFGNEPILKIHDFADGFIREDRRSWIDFHDGTSNLKRGRERKEVVAIKPANAGGQDWTLNGTYMVYMKLPVNLVAWDNIPRSDQELLVGRTMHSGCAITGTDQTGHPVVQSGCPLSGTNEVVEPGNELFREPPDGVSNELKLSHVQRANQHRQPMHKPDSRRIYRQGYEFLDKKFDGFHAGLHFVSFQDDPLRTLSILTLRSWLGCITFGGDRDAQSTDMEKLISCLAAGVFFVPPKQVGEAFPGSAQF